WIHPQDPALPRRAEKPESLRTTDEYSQHSTTKFRPANCEGPLAFYTDHEKESPMHDRKRHQRSQSNATEAPKWDVLPPETAGANQSNAPVPNAPQLPAALAIPEVLPPDLVRMEDQLRKMTATVDLDLPEGWLDSWFGRPDHRLRKKIERAELIAQF